MAMCGRVDIRGAAECAPTLTPLSVIDFWMPSKPRFRPLGGRMGRAGATPPPMRLEHAPTFGQC